MKPIGFRPGWAEFAIALLIYLICLAAMLIVYAMLPAEAAALKGVFGNLANGVAGLIAFTAAFAWRIRRLAPFGFVAVSWSWILAAIAIGILAFGLSFVVEGIYFHFIDEPNTQGDMQAAAKAGLFSLVALLVAVGMMTPIAEELVFRGVIANMLGRYGAWIGVLGSAALFGIVHGISVILLIAFLMGIILAIFFRKSGSIWPCIALHMTYNSLHVLYYSVS